MSCEEIRVLLNREVDGRTTPEEEAVLMQHVSSCESCAADQRAQRGLQQAVRTLRDEPVPAGLASRIADAVLARSGPVIPRTWWRSMQGLRQAAAVLLVVGASGVAGWYLSGDHGVVAAPPVAPAGDGGEGQAWRDLGAPREAAERILAIKAKFEYRRAQETRTAPKSLHDLETAEILEVLAAHPTAYDAYLKKHPMSEDEARRLMSLLRK
jgi:anti-sigma factor RsiW